MGKKDKVDDVIRLIRINEELEAKEVGLAIHKRKGSSIGGFSANLSDLMAKKIGILTDMIKYSTRRPLSDEAAASLVEAFKEELMAKIK
ncbi:hypothetical protein KAR26_03745 [Candidatus Parcubacteria bacterium]|nr:hypothetical protein [Candidatus Parcubacteria bacterium]